MNRLIMVLDIIIAVALIFDVIVGIASVGEVIIVLMLMRIWYVIWHIVKEK